MKILLVLFLAGFLVDGFSLYQVLFSNSNNLVLMQLYTPLEYGLITLVFAYWQRNLVIKRILYLSVPAFILIFVFNKIFIENWEYFDNVTTSIECILLVLISSHSIFQLRGYENIHKIPQFWVSVSVMIYFCGNIFFFAYGNEDVIWFIPPLLGTITNLIFAGGYFCSPYRLISAGV